MKAIRRLLAVLLGGAMLVALSCREPAPFAVDPLLDLPPPPTGLLQCSPLPADSVTQTIGPAGGVLQVGAHALTIPPGALDSAVAITAVAPSGTGEPVNFHPGGLTFQPPASLTMGHPNRQTLRSTPSEG